MNETEYWKACFMSLQCELSEKERKLEKERKKNMCKFNVDSHIEGDDSILGINITMGGSNFYCSIIKSDIQKLIHFAKTENLTLIPKIIYKSNLNSGLYIMDFGLDSEHEVWERRHLGGAWIYLSITELRSLALECEDYFNSFDSEG